MKLKVNLFVKVFLGFWLVSAVILSSWLLTARYFDSLPDRRPDIGPEGPPRAFMLRLFYELQNTADGELPALLKKLKSQHKIEVFLLKPSGEDLYQRELTPGVARAAAQLDRRHRRRATETPNGYMLAHFIHRDTAGPLRAVMVFKPRRQGVVSVLNKHVGLRLILAIILSGLVCYLLSRALTRRIKKLRLAARSLAQGDLGTRITVRETGGDETDELARDLNSMAAQLDDKIQAQKRLLSNVSHELRSPLARLHIASALAQQDPDNIAQHIARIDLEAERLEALIKQLLSSQGENASLDSYIDLVSLLTQLCGDASFEGEQYGKQVIFSTRLAQAVIPSHGEVLKSCFENILRNAIKYTADDSIVEATLTQDKGTYIIRVEDCGPGVKQDELDKLFDEFYRADSARQRETGGYGLGLSISRRAVALHRGEIKAMNTDKGLAMIVTLPIAADQSL